MDVSFEDRMIQKIVRQEMEEYDRLPPDLRAAVQEYGQMPRDPFMSVEKYIAGEELYRQYLEA